MKSTSVYLNIAEFTWEAGKALRGDPDGVVSWLENFCEALSTGKKGISSLADSLLAEAEEFKAKDRERKKEVRQAIKKLEPEPQPPKIRQERPKKEPIDTADFERFWASYPKKVGKLDAKRAWDKAKGKPPIDQIVDIVETQKQSTQWTKDNGQYIPNPSTWINQGRWGDEVEKVQTWESLESDLDAYFKNNAKLLGS